LNIGTMIDGNIDQTNNSSIEKYCYDDMETNCNTYGGLYQWNELMEYTTTVGTQGICPESWHVASSAEWETLISYVSDDGNALKAIGQGSGLGAGTNTSGFSALLAGNRDGGSFSDLGILGIFWNSTNQTYSFAYRFNLGNEIGEISGGTSVKSYGYSVRCVKD